MIERQVIVTWSTMPEQRPPEGIILLVTVSGRAKYVTFDHAFALAEWYSDDGWTFEDETFDDYRDNLVVHAWADIEPYGGDGE